LSELVFRTAGRVSPMSEPGNTTIQLQHWLSRLRAGDAQGRNELLNHACERLRKLTHRMLRGFPRLHRWEQTDDVLHNAMMRLHRALSEQEPESLRHFFNLATLLIRRELIDLTNHHFGPQGQGARHDTDKGGDRQRHAVAPGEPASLDEWTDFHSQVQALPEDEREVVSLVWYEGLKQDEAAAVLGVSERTLRRRWLAVQVKLYHALSGEPRRHE
jgi:RNA polymerase sigma-70 factor (ECF subfamily)